MRRSASCFRSTLQWRLAQRAASSSFFLPLVRLRDSSESSTWTLRPHSQPLSYAARVPRCPQTALIRPRQRCPTSRADASAALIESKLEVDKFIAKMGENRPGLAVDEESQRAEEAWQLADATEERLGNKPKSERIWPPQMSGRSRSKFILAPTDKVPLEPGAYAQNTPSYRSRRARTTSRCTASQTMA